MFLKYLLNNIFFLFIILQQTNKSADSLLFDKGQEMFLKNNWENAEKYLHEHLSSYPVSKYRVQVLFLLGEIKFKQKKYGLALKTYKEALKLNPEKNLLLKINLKIDETLYHLGTYESLTDALYHFIDTNPDSVDSDGIIARTMMRISRMHLEKKEYYSALVMLERLQNTYPHSSVIPEAVFEKANIYKLLGDNQRYKQTLVQFTAKKDSSDIYTYALIELANLYFDEQKYDSSLLYWGVLARGDEKHQDMALLKVAEIYNKIGQRYEAIIVIQTLIDKFPYSKFISNAYLLLAEIFMSQGDFQQAEKNLIELQTKTALEPAVLLKMGDIYFAMEDYDAAVKIYLRASETFKEQRDESARALILAGDAAFAKGDTVNARKYYLSARLIALSEAVKNLAALKMNRLE
ncbi:MAG: tetratricopeptide repeat protein [bacterium]